MVTLSRRCIASCFSALVLFLAWVATAKAQDLFTRNDDADFTGIHNVVIFGTDPDNFFVKIDGVPDFRNLKLRVKTGARLTNYWHVEQIKVDIDADGTWDREVGNSDTHIVTHLFPHPAPGDTVIRQVRFEVKFVSSLGGGTPPQFRIYYSFISILPSPRAYTNQFGDTFIQLRDVDCSTKIPVLMVEGFDAENASFPALYSYLTSTFINADLYPNNFEVFILNFRDGGRDQRLNAEVVVRAIQKIRSLCPNYRVVVAGLSMGGVVTRYALAKEEAEGREHGVGVFLSYDSPQIWAHISPHFQDYIKEQDSGNAVVAALQANLNSVAAKQLLGYNTYDPSHTFRNSFFNELNTLNGNGYPHKSYNVAISNGNLQATYGGESVTSLLATFSVIANNGTPQMIDAIPMGERDCGPGSMMNDLKQTRYGDIYTIPFFLDLDWKLDITRNPVFIPTWSSLHLSGVVLDDITLDISSHTGSPFDDYDTQEVPQLHSAQTPASRSRIMNWLERTSTLAVAYNSSDGIINDSETIQVNVLNYTQIAIPPRYLVIDGQERTYVFDRWDDGSTQNPRTFALSHDLARAVIMKRVVLTASSGTDHNNLPRIVEAGATNHAVYASGTSIWHTRNHLGAGWQPEKLISANMLASQPTLHKQVGNGWLHLYAAWLMPGSTGGIGFATDNGSNGGVWSTPTAFPVGVDRRAVLLATPKCDAPGAPYPCYSVLMWADGGSQEMLFDGGVYYMKSPHTTGTYHLIPHTIGNVTGAVAVGVDECPCEYREFCTVFRVAFVRDGRLFSSSFLDPNPNAPATPLESCSSPVEISTSGWTASNPAIASRNGTVYFAWEETNGTIQRIAFRQRSSAGSWSGTTYFTHAGHVATKPALGIDEACGSIKLLWQCANHIARASRSIDGSAWAAPIDLGEGRAPSIAPVGVSGATAMWTIGANAPYAFNWESSCDDVTPPGLCELAPDLWLTNYGIGVEWTAPGDDGSTGTATEYDIRWRLGSSGPLTEGNWYTAVSVVGEPNPTIAGTSQSHFVGGLTANTWYYVGIRARDEMENWGPISTVYVKTMASGGGGGGAAAEVGRDDALGAVGLGVASARLAIESGARNGGLAFRAYRLSPEESALLGAVDSAEIIVQRQGEAGLWERAHLVSGANGEIGLSSRRMAPRRVVLPGQYALKAISEHVTNTLGQAMSLSNASRANGGALAQPELTSPPMEPGDTLIVQYAMTQGEGAGASDWCLLLGISTSTGAARAGKQALREAVPVVFALHPGQPNPFSGSSRIRFDLPREAHVRVDVLDLQGRVVSTLADRLFPAGQHAASWDRRSHDGRMLPAGVYFCRMVAGEFRSERKITALP